MWEQGKSPYKKQSLQIQLRIHADIILLKEVFIMRGTAISVPCVWGRDHTPLGPALQDRAAPLLHNKAFHPVPVVQTAMEPGPPPLSPAYTSLH